MIASGADLTRLNEGCRLISYPDPGGVWTIGWGHTGPEVREGLKWTQGQADAQFANDYAVASTCAAMDAGTPTWAGLSAQRQAVLADMAFELGGYGLAQFHDFLAAIGACNWPAAGQALHDSLLFEQVPERENRNIQILLTGDWPQEDV